MLSSVPARRVCAAPALAWKAGGPSLRALPPLFQTYVLGASKQGRLIL